MAEKKQEPVFTSSGTHVFMTTPTGALWESPADYVEIALLRGFELAEAPVDDGVHGDEPAPAKKAASKKTSGD